MRFLALAAVAAASVFAVASYGGSSARPACPTGGARGFAAIQPDPPFLVGTIPPTFSAEQRFFARRFNCRRQPPQVRRVSLGIYDVRFPGLQPELALATATSQEGITASAYPIADYVRVALRGPLGGGDVAMRRDVAFSIVIY